MMVKELIDLFNSNNIKVYDNYPTKVPPEFIVIKNDGQSNNARNVTTYNFKVLIYYKYKGEAFLNEVIKTLAISSIELPYCGNPKIQTGDTETLKNGMDRTVIDFSVDKVRWL